MDHSSIQGQGVEPVDLLWTGGWDSTFRLLQLVLEEKRPVRPHYLIDDTRPSIGNEILAMNAIKRKLFKKFPHTRALVLPTEYKDVLDIAEDAVVSGAYKALVSVRHIGSQYDWLARYCKEKGIAYMELGFESAAGGNRAGSKAALVKFLTEGRVQGRLRYDFKTLMKPCPERGARVRCFDEKLCSVDEFTIFKYFGTGIVDFSKIELKQIAEEKGFIDLMDLTWFCHTPIWGRYPCGRCNPCTDALQKGMGYRVPLFGKVSNVAIKLLRLRKLKKLLGR